MNQRQLHRLVKPNTASSRSQGSSTVHRFEAIRGPKLCSHLLYSFACIRSRVQASGRPGTLWAEGLLRALVRETSSVWEGALEPS